jgi:hypothetical protein
MPITESTLAAGARPQYRISKLSATSEGAGTRHSLWKVAGNPTAGANPTVFGSGGIVETNATVGSIAQPNGTNQLRMIALRASSSVAGKLIVYDRLWACSGFGTVVTTLQTIAGAPAFPTGRLKDGTSDYSDVELWLEVYTAPGATGATWTIIGPDGGGTSRTMTYTHPANAETVGQMMQVAPLAAAAAGFRIPTSFQCSVSSGTAGDIGLTLMRPIAEIEIPVITTGAFRGAIDLGLERVRDGACLALAVDCTATTTGVIQGGFHLSDVNPA